MSTVHDLRETLQRRAEGLDDTERHNRAAAVRRRVRVARRRRAIAAVAAGVVVAGGAGAIAMPEPPGTPDPADHTVVGLEVSEDVTVLGFPYRFSGTSPVATDTDALRLPGEGTLWAVSLVGNGLGDGSATLYLDDTAVARTSAGEPVSTPAPVRTPVSGGGPGVRVELHDVPADARLGVAVYAWTGELPDGVRSSDGLSVFRSSVAGDQLLDAAFAEPGEARATLTYTAPGEKTRVTAHCRSDERGLWFRVQHDGLSSMHGQCGDSDPDAGGTSWTSPERAGSAHTLEVVVTRGKDGPVATDADVTLGAAAYRAGSTVRVGGANVTAVVEHAGRTWRLDTTYPDLAEGESRRVVADTDLLVGFVAEGQPVRATWRGALTSGATSYAAIGEGPGTMVDGVLLGGDTYDVALESDGLMERGSLLVYRPLHP